MMSPRNPFAFLDGESRERTLLLLLLAILHKSGDTLTLSLADLTAIEDGASFHKYPDDTTTSLVLRFARRGAEAFFLPPEDAPSPSLKTTRPSPRTAAPSTSTTPDALPSSSTSPAPPARHAIHDDLDLALREEEMASRSESSQRERLRQARADAGAMPWRNVPRQ